jgi:hypothetical protein
VSVRSLVAGTALIAALAVPPPAGAGTGVEVLSVPGKVSRWAFVFERAIARVAPQSTAKAVARLKLKTEDGTDELVLALRRQTDAAGRKWVQVRLPILPNGRTGWVAEEALTELRTVRTWLRIDRRRLTATLVRSGRVVFRARIGIGRAQWPTPAGEFYVRDRLEGFPKGGPYGPLAFGTSAHSPTLTDWPGGGVVGIHGTNQPNLLPGRISHGCIRMKNNDILRLGRLMTLGTPITIR